MHTFIQSTCHLLGGLSRHFEFQVVGAEEVGRAGDGQVDQATIAVFAVLWQLSVDILFAEGLAAAWHGTGWISATNKRRNDNLEHHLNTIMQELSRISHLHFTFFSKSLWLHL